MPSFLFVIFCIFSLFSAVEDMPHKFDINSTLSADEIEHLIENNSFDYLPDEKAAYESIQDIHNPTYNDYRRLQTYLQTGERDYIKYCGSHYQERLRKFHFVTKSNQTGTLHKYTFGKSNPDDRGYCIVAYTSLNSGRPFKKSMQRNIIDRLKETGFNGHLLWQEGGFPNVAHGSLHLAHTPYSWKVAIIRQAYHMGYRKILWADVSMSFNNANGIFRDFIEKDGYYTNTVLCFDCDKYGGPMLNKYFNLSKEEAKKIPTTITTICGFNFDTEIGNRFFNLWYKSFYDMIPICCDTHDQTVFSVIADRLGVKRINRSGWITDDRYVSYKYNG